MRGMGTHPRVGPEGLRISRRVVTSKVRHLVPPLVSALLAASGRARPAATRLAAPAFRKDRLSMNSVLPFLDCRPVAVTSEWYREGYQSQIGFYDDKTGVPLSAPITSRPVASRIFASRFCDLTRCPAGPRLSACETIRRFREPVRHAGGLLFWGKHSRRAPASPRRYTVPGAPSYSRTPRCRRP